MQDLYDTSAPKKATNLSINSDLLNKIRSIDINLSATLEKALRIELERANAKKWRKDNKNAIEAYNEFVEEHGLFSDEFRSF
tara:strand:- start:29012 stop:29257 length:246 start_codon:yes stop_codon:yes gene_type:complete